MFRPANLPKIFKWTKHLVVVENDLFGKYYEDYVEWKSLVTFWADLETTEKMSLTIKRNQCLSMDVKMVYDLLPARRMCLLPPTRKGLDASYVFADLQHRVEGVRPWPHVLEFKGVRPWTDEHLFLGGTVVSQPPEDLKVVLWLDGPEGVEEHRKAMEEWLVEELKDTYEEVVAGEDEGGGQAAADQVAKLLRGADVRVLTGPKSWDLVEAWGGEEESDEHVRLRFLELAEMAPGY